MFQWDVAQTITSMACESGKQCIFSIVYQPQILHIRVTRTDFCIGGDRGPMGGNWRVIDDKICANKQKMYIIRVKNGYLALSLIKKLLFYPNFSPKYVLFVKCFNHSGMPKRFSI